MNNTSELKNILHDAISDYSSYAEEKAPAEWLQDYLGRKLPEKSVETIQAISGEILGTLDLMEQKKASLNNAIAVGESAEGWLTKEVMKGSESNGSKARAAAEFLNGITLANQTYDSTIEEEIIDVDGEVWNDDEWNDYKLKNTLNGVASEIGKAGLCEIASDVFLKASEKGISAVLDGDFVKETLVDGVVGAFTGGLAACATGVSVAIFFGYLVALIFKPRTKTF